MPRRGRGPQNQQWPKYQQSSRRSYHPKYSGHRYVNFKRKNNYNREHQSSHNDGNRNDIIESSSGTSYRGGDDRRNRQRMNYQRSPRRYGFNSTERDDPDTQWFKITIPHGGRYDKRLILQSIQDQITVQFTPYNYHHDHGSAVFFVLGMSIADTLKAISRRISAPNGSKLLVLSNRSAIPPTPVNDELTNTIKNTMSNRYSADLKVLDLSKFRDDPNLKQLGLYVPLSRQSMLNLVVKIITEHIPDVIGLNLSDNKLASLEPLMSLTRTCKWLRAIDFSLNQINNATELEFIKDLELTELVLDGNPLCESFGDQSIYISTIRSRFPKLTKLDNDILPAQIGFDVEDTSNLPQIQGSHLPDDVKQFILGFFEAYYNLYDSENRQQLIQAYHDNAFFSMSLARANNMTMSFSEKLISESRNLVRIKDISLRNKLLKQGKVNIVSSLDVLPKTKHEPNSFVIDVPFYNNMFVQVVVNGVYREIHIKQSPLRAFTRTFFIIPQGQGFVIVNDLLLLTNATVQQIQKYGQMSHSNDKMFMDGDGKTKTSTGSITRSIDNNDAVIQNLMSATGLNRAYAKLCLDEYGFDFNKAIGVVNELKIKNAIPPDAFA